MQLDLSQDDLRVTLQILTENLAEAGGLDGGAPKELRLQVPAVAVPPAGWTTSGEPEPGQCGLHVGLKVTYVLPAQVSQLGEESETRMKPWRR